MAEHTAHINDGVQITELSDSDTTHETSDISHVDKKETIQTNENERTKIIKKTKKTKSKSIPTKEKEDIVEEVEVVEEITARKSKKAMRKFNSTEMEEDVDEDELKPLQTFAPKTEKQVPLDQSRIISETVSTRQITQIQTGQGEVGNAVVDVLPYTAITKEETLASESEQDGKHVPSTCTNAIKTLDTLETYQITEINPVNTSGKFDKTFKPASVNATPNIVTNTSVTVSEIKTNDFPNEYKSDEHQSDTANVTVLMQEATHVSEIEISQKEIDFEKTPSFKSFQASPGYELKESVEIQEIQQGDSETSLSVTKPVPAKPKIDVNEVQSLVVEEVVTETKPGKHMPEAFVATEVANKNIIPQRELTTMEVHAPELTGAYEPDKRAPTQTSAVSIELDASVTVSETRTEENEVQFEGAPEPIRSTAKPGFELMEGLISSTTDSQMPSKDIETLSYENERANVDFIPKETVMVQSNTPCECDDIFTRGELPEGKTGESSITCLEVSDTFALIVQEKEGDMPKDKAPSSAQASKSVTQVEGITTTQIQSSDFPAEFSGQFVFQTQLATPNLTTIEAKEITMTQSADKETVYQRDTLQGETGTYSLSGMNTELLVQEQSSMEKEHPLERFELPDSNKGKPCPTHFLSTGVAEETVPENALGNLSDQLDKTVTAKTLQECYESTVISAPNVNETFEPRKDDVQIGQKANMEISPSETFSVQETEVHDKEGDYIVAHTTDLIQPESQLEGRPIACKTEVHASDVPAEFEKSPVNDAQAQPGHYIHSHLQVSQFQTIEKEQSKETLIMPDSQSANVDITDSEISMSISQVHANEKESELIMSSKPLSATALTGVSISEAYLQEQQETVTHADHITEPEILTGKAKKYATPNQELIITEANATEVHKALEEQIFPDKKSATVNILPGSELVVTEVISNEKEDIVTLPNQDEKVAEANITAQSVAQIQEVISNNQLGDFQKLDVVSDVARKQQDTEIHLIQTEALIEEKEAELVSQEKPNAKQSNVTYELGESIVITQAEPLELENVLDIAEKPKSETGAPNIDVHSVAMKAQVITEDTTKQMSVEDTHEKSKANITQTLLESISQTQSIVQEKEGIFEKAPVEEKSPLTNIELGEGVGITSVVICEQEKDLQKDELPDVQKAEANINPPQIAESQVTNVLDTFTKFDKISPVEDIANLSHTELKSLIQSEVISIEAEMDLSAVAPTGKTANVNVDEQITVHVTETLTAEQEDEFKPKAKPDEVKANAEFSHKMVAESQFTVLQGSTGVHTPHEPVLTQASQQPVTMESIIQTELVVSENEKYFEEETIKQEQAGMDYVPKNTLMITEVMSGDKEMQYDSPTQPILQLASKEQDNLESLQIFETSVSDTIRDFSEKSPDKTQAELAISALPIASKLETCITEQEHDYTSEHVQKSTAQIGYDQDFSVNVETVIISEKESDLSLKEQPEMKTVTTVLGDLGQVATNKEIISNYHLNTFEDTVIVPISANKEIQPYVTPTQSETIVNEVETILQPTEKHPSHKADVKLDNQASVMIDNVVTAEKEEIYESLQSVEPKIANVNIDVHELAVQQERILTSDSLDTLKIKPTVSETVQPTQELYSSVTVTEKILEDREQDFEGKFKPEMSEAKIALEQGKCVQITTEVTSDNKEGILETAITPENKKAITSVSTLEIAEKTEVHAAGSVSESITAAVVSKDSANVNVVALESVVSSQPIIQEKETDLALDKKHDTKKADFALEGHQGVAISETVANENEVSFEGSPKPKTSKATFDILEKINIQTSITTSSDNVESLDIQEPNKVMAQEAQTEHQSVIHSQPLAIDKEGDLNTVEPLTKNAVKSVDEFVGLTISEVLTSGVEGDLDTKIASTERASTEINTMQAVERTQNRPLESINQFAPIEHTTTEANVTMDNRESVIASELIIHEQEKEFTQKPVFDSSLATTTFEENKPIHVSEILPEEKEISVEDKSYDTRKALPGYTELESVIQTEITTQSNIGDLSQAERQNEKAQLIQDSEFREGIITSEKHVQEKESVFEATELLTKSAEQILVPLKHITISETTTHNKEQEYAGKPSFTGSNAQIDFNVQEVVVKAETVASESYDQMKTEMPTTATANKSQLTMESVSVTSTQSAEKEDLLSKAPSMPNKETAGVSQSQALPLNVTEVYSEEVGNKLQPASVIPDKATAVIPESKHLEQFETMTMTTIQDFVNKEHSTTKAHQKQTTFDGLTTSVVSTIETETMLPVEERSLQVVNVNIDTRESVEVTQIQAHETEGSNVMIRKADENVVKPSFVERQVALQEEVESIQAPDKIIDKKMATEKANTSALEQHSLQVTCVDATGSLESLHSFEDNQKKAVKVLVPDKSASIVIHEVLPNEHEGEYWHTIPYVYLRFRIRVK